MRKSILGWAFVGSFALTLVAPLVPENLMVKLWADQSSSAINELSANSFAVAKGMFSMNAIAAETGNTPINVEGLMKISEADSKLVKDGSVPRDILSTIQIRKIAFGRTTMVDIVTTPSGTYSSDGLNNPHIQYPGIRAEAKPTRGHRPMLWVSGLGWTAAPDNQGSSFVYFGTSPSGGYIVGDHFGCFSGENFTGCS